MLPSNFKPLLAIDSQKVKQQSFPMYLSEKLDGIRCIVFGGVAYSRSLKPLPNLFIQAYVKEHRAKLEGLDGEIIVGDKNAPDVFTKSTSGVMSIHGEPDFTFWVFDEADNEFSYSLRYSHLKSFEPYAPDRVRVLQHFPVLDQASIDEYEGYFLGIGAEGVMLRDPEAQYKFGRAGTKNPELQKVKRFVDKEFKIVGYEPKYTNTNEAITNELGRTARSTAKEGLVALDTMGALQLVTEDGTLFSCGSGFTDEIRTKLWEQRHDLLGKLATVKYFDIGNYIVPRFPVFKGIRNPIDIS